MTTAQEKKMRLLRSYLGRHPVWCTWQVTYRCNFRCRFCGYWHDEMGKLPEQTVEQFAEGSAKLARWGSLLISLAGGEPLLRRDIVEVVRAVGRWHFPFVTTNGYLATKDLARELFAAGLWGVSVSIDYADAERHDEARGREGAYERAVKALEMFSAARQYDWQRVNLMGVLLDDNLDEVEKLIKLAAEHDAYFMIQPYSELKTGEMKYRPRGDGKIGEYLVGLRKKHANFLSNPSFLARYDEALNGGVRDCAAGKAFFNIDSTGDIAICVEERARPIANLYEHGPAEIAKRLKQGAKANKCYKCWYNCRGEVESLYNWRGLVKSLPTWLFDTGRPRVNKECG
ncbi:MAG: radical SAM protein [Sedimentisphaerales bacterium]|nr:radical SAM protein [Sedimentisphaerales bacterium]